MSQVLASRPPVRIEDPDEPFLREAEDVAVAFINLALPDRESSTKKAPIYPKKTAGEPGLLRAEEGEGPQADQPPTELVPASLPLLEVTQIQQGRVSSSAAGGATADGTAVSRQIAERLKMIGDQVDKEIDDELKKQFGKTFSQISVYMLTRENFSSMCRSVLSRLQSHFTTGWQQISVVYCAMIQTVVAVRGEGADIPTQTRERQVANFVGPTLVDLGLYTWMASHGGMENFGNQVQGSDATATIEESSVDPE